MSNQNSDYTLQDRIDFVKKIYCAARLVSDESGCSWRLLIAQACQETGWGQSVIPGTNNIFNIKADGSWTGPVHIKPHTLEFIKGKAVYVDAPFRIYPEIVESIRDRVKFISDNPRYTKAGFYNNPGDPNSEADALQAAGYATAVKRDPVTHAVILDPVTHKPIPIYAEELKKTMNGPTMKKAIAEAQKQGCQNNLPTVNFFIKDASGAPISGILVKITQGSNSVTRKTNNDGKAQVQATISGGPITIQVWSTIGRKWLPVTPEKEIKPAMPPAVVPVLLSDLVIKSASGLHVETDDGESGADKSLPPESPASNESHSGYDTYTIKRGDSLSSIAKAHKITYVELAHINNIPSPYYIYAWHTLKIPKQGQSNQAAGQQKSQSTKSASSAAPKPASTAGVTTAAHHLPPTHGTGIAHSRNAASNPQTEVMNKNHAPWMKFAEEEFRKNIARGGAKTKIKRNGKIISANPESPKEINEYFEDTSLGNDGTHANIAYCAAFVNWCLTKAGYKGNDNSMAESLKNWGHSTEGNKPAYGAIAVVHIPDKKHPGKHHSHVTFVNGSAGPGRIATLGGNQGDAHEVSHSSLPESWVIAYRFPLLPHRYDGSADDYNLKRAVVESAVTNVNQIN